MKKPLQVFLNAAEARRQGYHGLDLALRAANRAVRWMRSPRNQRAVPPGHIRQKMRLMEVKP